MKTERNGVNQDMVSVCGSCGTEKDMGSSVCDCGGVLEPEHEGSVSLGEGGTPVVDCSELAAEVGVSSLVVKDESANPTNSFYDRGMARVYADISSGGTSLYSTGVSGVSAAAYAGRVGVDVTVAVPSRAPFDSKAYINVHGGDMTVVRGKTPEAKERHGENGFVDVTPMRRSEFVDGAADVGRELADRGLTDVFCPVGDGELLLALHLGLGSDVSLHVAQPKGCSPVARYFEQGVYEAVESPDTVVGEIEYSDPEVPERTLDLVGSERDVSGVEVEDRGALDVGIEVMQRDGVELSPAGAVAFAAAVESGLGEDSSVAVVNPAGAMGFGDVFRNRLTLHE